MAGTVNVTRERQKNEIMPETVTVDSIPMPPDYLSERGRELWTRLCMQQAGVGILYPGTFEYLEGYCRAYDIKEAAWLEMQEHGWYVWEGQTEKSPGVRRVSQAYKVYNEQVQVMLAIGAKLGISPVDKTKVSQTIASRTADKNSIKRIGVTG